MKNSTPARTLSEQVAETVTPAHATLPVLFTSVFTTATSAPGATAARSSDAVARNSPAARNWRDAVVRGDDDDDAA